MFWWQVVKLVRAIRNGWIKFDKPKEEPKYYHLWGDETDTADNKRQGLSYIPAPKPNLPGSWSMIFSPESFSGQNHWPFIFTLEFLLMLHGIYRS